MKKAVISLPKEVLICTQLLRLCTGFDGYVRPDHGRMIWGETGRGGYGLYDRALGAMYLQGIIEAVEKSN